MFYFGLHWREQVRVAPVVELSEEQRAELTRLARSKRTSVRLAQRARIVLLAAQGLQNKDIAAELGVGAYKSPVGASATLSLVLRASSAICRAAHRR